MVDYLITSGIAPVAAMILVAAAELLRSKASVRAGTGRRWILNLSLYVLDQALALALAPLVTAFIEVVAGASPLADATGALPWWERIILGLLALDAASYGLHLASHHVAPLWRLHAVHHSDRAMDVTTAVRHHPAELVPAALVIGGCGALLGLTPWDVAIYSTLSFAVQLVAHAELRLPRPLMRAAGLVLVTPEMHYLHHSRLQRETNSNYGQMFSFWDRLFRSYALRPASAGEVEFGLDTYAGERFHSVHGALLQPFLRPDGPPASPGMIEVPSGGPDRLRAKQAT